MCLRFRSLRSLLAAFLLVSGPALHVLDAQVMPSRNWARTLAQARGLLPGTGNDGVAYHLHYDLHFRGPHKSDLTGTYDVYVDPYRFRRTDMASGEFHETDVEDLQHSADSWHSVTGEMPLGMYDFEGIVEEPRPAVFALEHSMPGSQLVARQQILEGSPYQCVDDQLMTRLCFDPFTHVFALAQILNQSFVYGNWIAFRRRAIPSLVQIYDGSTRLVSADGKIEEVHQFVPMFFVRNTPQDTSPFDSRPLVKSPEFQQVPWFGNAVARVTVDEEGKVKHADMVEIDNQHIEHAALKFIHGLRFKPASEAPGSPATFTALFYVRYLPRTAPDPE